MKTDDECDAAAEHALAEMRVNPEAPAYPRISGKWTDLDYSDTPDGSKHLYKDGEFKTSGGMSIRAKIASEQMAAIIAHQQNSTCEMTSREETAICACELTDALIAERNKDAND